MTQPRGVNNIKDQLALDEARRLTPYRDTRGLWTGGIGHCFQTDQYAQIPALFLPAMTEDQCDALFDADLHHVWDLLDVYLPWWSSLDGNSGARSNVLVNMAFNLGVAGLAQFHNFLKFMRGQEWAQAAADLKHTPWYSQVGDRAARLQQQIITGAWQ